MNILETDILKTLKALKDFRKSENFLQEDRSAFF